MDALEKLQARLSELMPLVDYGRMDQRNAVRELSSWVRVAAAALDRQRCGIALAHAEECAARLEQLVGWRE